MTKEDIADLLMSIGTALKGLSTKEGSEEQPVQEVGVIEESQIIEEAPQPQVPTQAPTAIEVPNMAEQIKQIFDQQNADPHKLAMLSKEREIQLLREQIAALQQSNNQVTGNIG